MKLDSILSCIYFKIKISCSCAKINIEGHWKRSQQTFVCIILAWLHLCITHNNRHLFTRSWGISNEVILVWIQIDRRFRYEPTKTGYESTECGYETTADTKKLNTVKKKLVKLRFLCNIIFLESSNQVCCLCESGYFDKLRRPGEGVISKKAYYYWNFFNLVCRLKVLAHSTWYY